jgi:hypothetical protein
VIEVCREFVSAQREYGSRDQLGDGLMQYAAKFESSGGRHDGLYWQTSAGEEPSPLGPWLARARAEGYPVSVHHDHASGRTAAQQAAELLPYHGYYFRKRSSAIAEYDPDPSWRAP